MPRRKLTEKKYEKTDDDIRAGFERKTIVVMEVKPLSCSSSPLFSQFAFCTVP